MTKDIQQIIEVRPGYQVKRGAVKCESGLSTLYHAQAIFDTAANDSSGVSNKTVAAHGLGVFIPASAIITKSFFQTKTGFTSGTSAATVALSAKSANDLFTATIITNGALVGAGFNAGVPDGTVTHMIGLTAEKELTATVATEALTAGKLIVHVDYVISL